MIIIDTNIIIEIYKRNEEIISTVEKLDFDRICISDITVSELYFGARNSKELNFIQKDLQKFQHYSVNEQIPKKAVDLAHKFSLSHKLSLGDSYIAATTLHFDFELFTLNKKDFKYIENLKLFNF
ncbi:type II toxin-antitoxin system VapC family toxin [Halpernia frigidisoli]|uniref:PIN domain-containing protein n=1 Tax=Halpernia frigidisoli TaxID=1125876 RepID=A0A1I3HRZ8_9FLAO|nr:type II toxin-antitoxin system VapC family toxin [Halpernia frigidisoli]SFI38452.1 hypothetical protein/tRNA(fMet)-specific endonuclease VapC [Halpernia frigidisoli]